MAHQTSRHMLGSRALTGLVWQGEKTCPPSGALLAQMPSDVSAARAHGANQQSLGLVWHQEGANPDAKGTPSHHMKATTESHVLWWWPLHLHAMCQHPICSSDEMHLDICTGLLTASAACRPVVKRADDCSNFDDYSTLAPMKHDFELSNNEQAMFAGF